MGSLKSAIIQIAIMWLVVNFVFRKGVVVEKIDEKTGEKQVIVKAEKPYECYFHPHEMMVKKKRRKKLEKKQIFFFFEEKI